MIIQKAIMMAIEIWEEILCIVLYYAKIWEDKYCRLRFTIPL